MTQAAHTALIRDIQRELSRGDTRLFLTPTGIAWQGTIVERTTDRITLLYPRTVHFGATGISDLTGFSAGGIYTAIEGKTGRGRLTQEQEAFIGLVNSLGGRAGVARSVEEAKKIISK
jgi:hypothetical protein